MPLYGRSPTMPRIAPSIVPMCGSAALRSCGWGTPETSLFWSAGAGRRDCTSFVRAPGSPSRSGGMRRTSAAPAAPSRCSIG